MTTETNDTIELYLESADGAALFRLPRNAEKVSVRFQPGGGWTADTFSATVDGTPLEPAKDDD